MEPQTLELYGEDIKWVGMRFADARRQRGMTQRDVAQRTCRSQSRVSDVERGNCDPRLSTLIRHAEAIGYTLQVRLVRREAVS